MHEGFHHSCNHCEHKSSQKQSLKRRHLSKHCCKCSPPPPPIVSRSLLKLGTARAASWRHFEQKPGGEIGKRRSIFFVPLFMRQQAHFWWDSMVSTVHREGPEMDIRNIRLYPVCVVRRIRFGVKDQVDMTISLRLSL